MMMDQPREKNLMNPHGIRSQREVGKLLGISKGRVHQIEQKALIKLVRGLQADEKLRRWWEDCQA